MATRTKRTLARAETWWWTGPLGHLVAGVIDWAQALAEYALRRARERVRHGRARSGGG